MNIAIVTNAASGTSNKQQLEQILVELGLTPEWIDFEQALETEIFKNYLQEQGITHVIAAGGDGTVNVVSSALVHTDITLVVVPQGTFNHFAKHLLIPLDTADSLRLLLDGQTTYVDTGLINDNLFLNFVSAGLYTDIIKARSESKGAGLSKRLSLIPALARQLIKQHRFDTTISRNEADLDMRTSLLFVSNNVIQFGSLDILDTRESFTDGTLMVLTVQHKGIFKTLILIARALFTDISNKLDARAINLSSCTFVTKNEQELSVDGELMSLGTTLNFSSQPRSLKVVVPKEFITQ